MKKYVLLLISLCLLLSACGSESVSIPEKKTYYDNASVKGLAINAEINLEAPASFTEMSDLIVGDSNGIQLNLCDDYIAKKAVQSQNRLDEYGIFHCKDANGLDALYQSVQQYVKSRKNNHQDLSNYADADTVKNGKVSVFGNYVVYSFLPGIQNDVFHDIIEEMLIE